MAGARHLTKWRLSEQAVVASSRVAGPSVRAQPPASQMAEAHRLEPWAEENPVLHTPELSTEQAVRSDVSISVEAFGAPRPARKLCAGQLGLNRAHAAHGLGDGQA
eukprot:3542451-Amphidinium_carterae.2